MKSKIEKIKHINPQLIEGIICIVIALVILLFPSNKTTMPKTDPTEVSAIKNICELATLKSYYHNVAMYKKEPEGNNKILNDWILFPFGQFTQIGYKQYWIEYTGIVDIGIDVSQVQVNKPKRNGVVDIYIPDAKVLNVTADESSLSNPLSATGWFTTITGEEKAEAYAEAQKYMRTEAETDQALLRRAKDNAKLLLEKYIVNLGAEMGVNYSVNWLEKPL